MLLYSYLENKLPQEEVINLIKEAVELVMSFNSTSLSCSMIGMNKNMMDDYIKFTADQVCVGTVLKLSEDEYMKIPGLVGKPIYYVENPFPWMPMINLEGKTNFFDAKVTNYSRTSVLSKPEDNVIRFDADF